MRRTVLVVDDDEDIRDSLMAFFTNLLPGATLKSAASAEEALGMLDDSLDLVISDLRMGAMDGLTLLRRALDRAPRASRILMTAFNAADVEVRARAAGVPILRKPFDIHSLTVAVNEALA